MQFTSNKQPPAQPATRHPHHHPNHTAQDQMAAGMAKTGTVHKGPNPTGPVPSGPNSVPRPPNPATVGFPLPPPRQEHPLLPSHVMGGTTGRQPAQQPE